MEPEKNQRDKKVILIGFALVFCILAVTLIKPAFKKEPVVEVKQEKTYPVISADELRKKIQNKESLKVIDTRNIDIFNQDHIVDAIHVTSVNPDNIGATVSDTTTLLVIVGSGDAQDVVPKKVVDVLEGKGYSNVLLLAGGMASWKQTSGQTISWGDPTSLVDRSKVKVVTPLELKSAIDINKNSLFIVDTRQTDQFKKGHIASSVNIPLDNLEKERDKILSGKEIVVYGATEIDGFRGGVKIFDFGFPLVRILKGGFPEWESNKLPISTN